VSRLVVRTVPVSKLKPARYNPRKPLTPRSPAYRKLRASIERFGLVEPLVWNAASGRLVGGHARLRILKDLGFAEVPVSVVRLPPDKEKALNVVLNNQEAQGRYDPRKLAAVLKNLAGLNALQQSGFDESTLRTLTYTPAGPLRVDPEPVRVEVTLEIPAAVYDRVEPKLDRLMREYDLVSHLVWTGRERKGKRQSHKQKATTEAPRTQRFAEKKSNETT
jgi:ParB/Sulfiredoxin domain